jgi:hypothetical protein
MRSFIVFLALVACSRDSDAPKATPGLSTASATVAASASPGSTVQDPEPTATVTAEAVDAGAAPLRAWMKREMGPAFGARKLPETAALLEQVATHKVKGLSNWASIARDGAAAARAGNYEAVKASCRTCHEQFKAKYIETSRALAFP